MSDLDTGIWALNGLIDGSDWEHERQSYNEDAETWYCPVCGAVADEPDALCADCEEEGPR